MKIKAMLEILRDRFPGVPASITVDMMIRDSFVTMKEEYTIEYWLHWDGKCESFACYDDLYMFVSMLVNKKQEPNAEDEINAFGEDWEQEMKGGGEGF